MNRKHIGLLAALLTVATASGLGISSCGNENGPTASGGGVDRSKAPHVDAECPTDIGATICGVGNGTVTRNDDGSISVTGMNASGDGVEYTYSSDITRWVTVGSVDVTDDKNAITYSAVDATGTTQASVSVTNTAKGTCDILPTFTSAQGAGTAQYDIDIYNSRGDRVGGQLAADAKTPVQCTNGGALGNVVIVKTDWGSTLGNGQCRWTVTLSPDGTYTFTLPDGTTVVGASVTVTEVNSSGTYVYVKTKTVRGTGPVKAYTSTATSGS